MKMLLEIKQILLSLGKTYEPDNSPFHIEQIDSSNEFDLLENNLNDPETRERLVRTQL